MERIKCHIDLNEETFLTALTAKLQQPELADAYQLRVVSRIAARHWQSLSIPYKAFRSAVPHPPHQVCA
jgi:hypothetical protein